VLILEHIDVVRK